MYVVAGDGLDALSQDRFEVVVGRPMEECGRRTTRGVAKVDGDGVPLTSTDAPTITAHFKSLFGVRGNE
jgi:hypothetical protein